MDASIPKNNQGFTDLDAQAIKISGGINPIIASDTRNKENMNPGE